VVVVGDVVIIAAAASSKQDNQDYDEHTHTHTHTHTDTHTPTGRRSMLNRGEHGSLCGRRKRKKKKKCKKIVEFQVVWLEAPSAALG